MKIAASIFKTLFLCLCIIANTHLAYAQTASILPQGKTQFLDNNGKPLTSGTVDFYIPSTTTRKTTWQNSAETVANSNPVVLDAGGRAIIYGDGSYRQVVKDRLGNVIWDQVTSSTGSGSGGSTATGDGDLVGTIKPWAGMTAPNQYVFTYGQEISRTTYSALFTAITSSQSVFCTSGSPTLTGLSDTTNFWVGASVEVSCLAAGFSTIISKTSSSITLASNANVSTNVTAIIFPWGRGNGTTTFNVPDLRGFAIAGNNNMGGVASSQLNTTYFGATDPNSVGAAGGSQSKVLLTANLPPYTPAGAITNGAITITQNALINNNGSSSPGGAFSIPGAGAATISASQAISTFAGAAQGGTSTAFSLIQPTKTSNYIIKVTPDANSATANGVTDINGMTGSIGCGSGLTCTGNNISVNTPSTTITPKNLNTIRFASQYGQADWCANVIAAQTDIGSGNPGTIIIDSTAGPTACTGGSGVTIVMNPNTTWKFVSGGEYILNQNIQLGQGNNIVGLGGGTGPTTVTQTGVRLKWTGAVATPMISFINATHSRLADLGLNCNDTTDCIGIVMNSDNNPPSSENIIENFTITGFHFGVSIGSTSDTAVSGASCSGAPSQNGCSENDFFNISNFQMYGKSTDLTAEGFHINSLNAAQNSIIQGGNIQLVNIGVHIINMNDSFSIQRVNAGSMLGVTPTLFKIESSVINGPDLFNNESEAGSYAVVDHATGGASIWQGNQWNQAVVADGGNVITSISNSGGGVGAWTASGTVVVKSIGDSNEAAWTTSGSGKVVYYPSTTQPLPATSGGTGFSSYTAGELLAAGGTGMLATIPDVATGSALLSGGVGNLPAYGKVPLTTLATQAANTVVANASSGTASPTAFAMPSCSTSASALNWTTNTGFGCNTAISVAIANITGLGTGVATLLAGASSGTGGPAGTTSPTFTTPVIGAATGTSLKLGGSVAVADIADDKTGGDVLAYRFNSSNGRMVFGIGGGSGSPFFGYNLVFSSGNVWNIDRTGPFWFMGDPGGAGNFVVGTGTGTAGNTAGTDVQTNWRMKIDAKGHVDWTNNNVPLLTSCGTTPAITGNDVAGTITMGTGAPTGCIATFAGSYAAAPICTVTWRATPLASQSYTVSTTALTLTQTGTSSNKVDYICHGS